MPRHRLNLRQHNPAFDFSAARQRLALVICNIRPAKREHRKSSGRRRKGDSKWGASANEVGL